jgi:hypothetical protein
MWFSWHDENHIILNSTTQQTIEQQKNLVVNLPNYGIDEYAKSLLEGFGFCHCSSKDSIWRYTILERFQMKI